MNNVASQILECAGKNVRARDVARGFRVSFPIAAVDGHLMELSYEDIGSGQYRITDGGEFHSFLFEEDISLDSEAVGDALEELKAAGFAANNKNGVWELACEIKSADVGCTSWDLASSLAIAFGSIRRGHRESVPRFERKIRKSLESIQRAIRYDYTLNGIHFPIYVPSRHAVGIIVGSYGKTVNPVDVAWRQARPLVQLRLKQEASEPSNSPGVGGVALVMPEYNRPEIREILKDLRAQTFFTNHIKEFINYVTVDRQLERFDSSGGGTA